jgi:hypothetical protein
LLATVPDVLIADNADEPAVADSVVAIIRLARTRRVERNPEQRHAERDHYAEWAARMHDFLGAIIASTHRSSGRDVTARWVGSRPGRD